MKYLAKFLYVIPAKKSELFLIVLLFLFISVLDALGIGLIGPFMSLAVNVNLITSDPWLSGFYSSSNLKSPSQFVALLGLVIIVVFYFKSFLYYQIQNYVLRFCYAQQVKLRIRLLNTYLSLPYTFHLKTNSAHVIQNVSGETASFTNAIAIPLLNSIANTFVVFVLLLLLSLTDLLATTSILGLLVIAIIPFHSFRHQVARWGKEGTEASTDMIQVIRHAMGGLKETRVIGCEDYFIEQLSAQTNKYANAASRFHVFQQLPRLVVEVLLITFLIGFVSLSLVLVERSENLISVLGVFAISSVRLIPAASQLINSMGVLRNSQPTLDRLYLDLKELEKPDVEASIRNSNGWKINSASRNVYNSSAPLKPKSAIFKDKIVLDQISYCYPSAAADSLINISLNISKGESIALIGKSGAGKTTLADVILGLLIPQSGDIYVDNVSIYKDMRSWQNLIGYIPQSIFLIDDTIERNIAFGVPDHEIDQKRLNEAIRLAQLSDLIAQLPEGTQTVIGENGVRLSGGQRQRIGIARALYHEREILVLDEATSALDNETESLISQSIQNLSGTKTIIIIAHRLSTVEHCDRVYSMGAGKILKHGTYQEVVLDSRT